MKNLLIAILLIGTVSFGGLYFHERANAKRVQKDVTTLNASLTEMQTRLDEQEQEAASLKKHLEKTRDTALAKAEQVTHLEQVITNQDAKAATNVNPLAEMFKSPEMKKMIQSQQQTVLGPIVEKTYADYFGSLQLTPEQNATLKDLIMKKMMVGANMGVAMLGGDLTDQQRSDLMQQTKDQTTAADNAIKQFLGDANYQQFQDYEKTIPDRMTLNTFKDQLGASAALNADQQTALLQAMTDERQKFKFTTDFSDQNNVSANMGSMFTEEKINQFQSEQAQLNQLYVNRAQSILSPDQLNSYQQFLASQRDMQAMGMKMAAKMFGKGGGN